MYDVVSVSFDVSNSIYFFSPNSLDLKKGDKVVVETENGLQFGILKSDVRKEKKENLILPLKPVVRLATKEDEKQVIANRELAEKALVDAKKISNKLELDMSFVDAYYTLDKSQLVFSFVSDNRVDFRELAKKLAQKYKTRIELRQIGVRDKSKKIGGLGPCGLFLCCNSFLTDFNSVSINMAKNQMLALNPTKINGICGRLLCCLGYEDDVYTELKKDLPKVGMVADTELGMGKVVSVDVFKGTYSVDLKEKGIIEFSKDKKNGSSK
ncbi:MAG: stage 0 sporulation protein [Firmicutes bacterium]|nr:stage 0 sporulation protein [Bacillota bacterium]